MKYEIKKKNKIHFVNGRPTVLIDQFLTSRKISSTIHISYVDDEA
jgi:hypothetical protein